MLQRCRGRQHSLWEACGRAQREHGKDAARREPYGGLLLGSWVLFRDLGFGVGRRGGQLPISEPFFRV